MQKLFIISNESISVEKNKFYCDNIDLKSTPEGLNKFFEINLIARKSIKKRSHHIKIKNINTFSSIISFVYSIYLSTKFNNAKYLLISISPYTFLASIFLKIFGKSPIVYLRSDGFEEYNSIIGPIGKLIYFFMFHLTTSFSSLISCSKKILRNKKGFIVKPSQLDRDWFKNLKKVKLDKYNILYVGRLRKEKGIFSFLKMIKNKKDILLTIVGADKKINNYFNQKNISIKKIEKNKNSLIKYYDNHNIFILPSFTEGYPMVVLEALARVRPVVIFDEIEHIKGNRNGIYVSKRNISSFMKTIKFIKKNYFKIQKKIKRNKLPKNNDFIENLKINIEKYR